MLDQYLYEIIALIILLTLIIIYFLTKPSGQEEEENTSPTSEHIIEQAKEDTVVKEEENEPHIIENIDESIKEEQAPIIDTQTIYVRKKREVPPHEKIKKDDFKEFSGIKLLVAEDNMINQKVINALLQDSGINITMADDGQIALDILNENSDFDIILMDAHMPNIDGFEATRIIRANPDYENIVVVALSGDTAADDIKKMIDAGMEEQLEKPLRMDALYDVLYAYTQPSTNENELVEVATTQELNIDQGLNICGGDNEFYKDILNEFTQNYASSPQKISDFLENDKIELADALLLDFIGITANIGADNIRNIALNLKDAIKNRENESYLSPLKNFEKHLQVLLQEIKEYV